MAPLKVYVASITANPEIRKRVQRTLMLLDGLGIPFDAIDITKPGNEEHRLFMRQNALKEGEKATPLPPQFFHNDDYLGTYTDFEEAVEDDRITEFLRLIPNSKPPETTSKADKEDSDKENASGKKNKGDDESAEKSKKEVVIDAEEEGEEEEEDEGEWEDEEEEGEDEAEDENDVVQTLTLATPKKTEGKEKDEQKKENSADVEETAVIRLGGKVEETEEDEENEEEAEGEDEEWDEDEEYEEEEEAE